MAKKTSPGAKPRSVPPPSSTPELDTAGEPRTSKPAPRRRAAPARAPRVPKAAAEAVAAVEGSVPARRPRRTKLPTQAAEQSLTPAPVPTPDAVTDDDIRIRAYFLSLERGQHGGSEVDYWLQAERELRSKRRD